MTLDKNSGALVVDKNGPCALGIATLDKNGPSGALGIVTLDKNAPCGALGIATLLRL